MGTFKVSGDLSLGSDGKGTVRIQGVERIAATMQSRFKIVQGSYQYAPDEGARWKSIIGSRNAEGLLKVELVRVALKDPEVARAEVTKIDYNSKTRKAIASMRVHSVYGIQGDFKVEV